MKKSKLRKIIRESVKGLMNEQAANYDCSNRMCTPWGQQYVNHYPKWADPNASPSFQNANFADYRFRGGGGPCPASPGTWRWFDAIVLNPATVPIGPTAEPTAAVPAPTVVATAANSPDSKAFT